VSFEEIFHRLHITKLNHTVQLILRLHSTLHRSFVGRLRLSSVKRKKKRKRKRKPFNQDFQTSQSPCLQKQLDMESLSGVIIFQFFLVASSGSAAMTGTSFAAIRHFPIFPFPFPTHSSHSHHSSSHCVIYKKGSLTKLTSKNSGIALRTQLHTKRRKGRKGRKRRKSKKAKKK